MGICILGLGECGSTNNAATTRVTKTLNGALTELSNKSDTNVVSTIINIQKSRIKIGGIQTGPKCTNANIGNITQDIKSDQTVKINLNLKSSADLALQVSNAIKTSIENDQKNKQGIFTTASTENNTFNNTDDYIDNTIKTKIDQEVLTEISALLSSLQDGDIDMGTIYCNSPNFDAGNIVQKNVTQQVVDIILKAIQGAEVVGEFKNSNEYRSVTDQSNKNTGLTGLIDSLSRLVGSGFLAIILAACFPCIIIMCIICGCCGGLGMLFKGGGGKSAPAPAPAPAAASSFGKKLKKMFS